MKKATSLKRLQFSPAGAVREPQAEQASSSLVRNRLEQVVTFGESTFFSTRSLTLIKPTNRPAALNGTQYFILASLSSSRTGPQRLTSLSVILHMDWLGPSCSP